MDNAELYILQQKKIRAEKELEKGKSGMTGGLAAVLIGFLLIAFFSVGLGLFVLIVGALTAATGWAKRDNAKDDLAQLDKQIVELLRS